MILALIHGSFLISDPTLFICDGVSLKGNAYFFDKEMITVETEVAVINFVDCLVCFCFTTKRFGPHLPLLLNPPSFETMTLSSVSDQKLSCCINTVMCMR